ncbi:MAG: hypothetical protein MHM6MM_004471 [Cercozoa sp. M6MM]
MRGAVAGVCLAVGIACAWAISTQLRGAIQRNGGYPYAFSLNYVANLGSVIVLPLVTLPVARVSKWRGPPWPDLEGKRSVWVPVALLHLLATLTNFCFVSALRFASAADVSALFCTNPAFVLLLQCRRQRSLLRVAAVLVCISGAILISLAGVQRDDDKDARFVLGAALALTAGFGASLYKVLVERIMRRATSVQVAVLLSCIAVWKAVVEIPVILALNLTGTETTFPALPETVWWWIFAASLVAIVFNFLTNFGCVFADALFVATGTLVGIPVNLVIDTFYWGKAISLLQLLGVTCVMLGFFLCARVTRTRKFDDDDAASVAFVDSDGGTISINNSSSTHRTRNAGTASADFCVVEPTETDTLSHYRSFED